MTATSDVRALEERLRRAEASPEPDTSAVFDELLADDVMFVQAEGSSNGKEMVLAGHRPPKKRTFTRVENTEMELVEVDDAVVVSVRTEYTLPDRSFAFRTVRLWKRLAGAWKVVLVVLMDAPKSES